MTKVNFLRNAVKTVALLAVVTMMTSCNSGGNKQQKAETPETTKQAAPAKGGKLFDITDGQITAYKIQGARQVALSGDERTKMLAAIPAATKKGVGELKQGFNTVQENLATGVGYIISFQFKVSGKADYATLTDYYKSLGGAVASESDIQLKINYDWGRLTDCLYQEFGDNRTILVSFTTK